jgi:putative thioredoxin
MIDVTDATFQTEVIDRSHQAPVVVDLWAPWCGPCRSLSPILEKVIDDQGGKVVGVKVNVDENPGISQAFQVQSIPSVFAIRNGQAVDSFLGAQGEPTVRDFVTRLLPTEEEDALSGLISRGDEQSLRDAIQLDPDNEDAILALAELLIGDGRFEEGLELLARVPESPRSRHLAARARTGDGVADVESKLEELLSRVKGDEEARQEFVDLLELLGPDDPRTAGWRRRLTSALY